MAKKKKREYSKRATAEQLRVIDGLIREVGLGESLQDFSTKMLDGGSAQKFSRSLSEQIQTTQALAAQMAHNGSNQPLLSQSMFRQLSYTPMVASSEDIERWVMNPQANARNLRNLSQYLSYAVGQYSRAIWYFNTIKAFNYELIPCDSITPENKDEYMKAYQDCLDTLKKLNVKFQFPKMDLSVMYTGITTYWKTETNENIQFIQLPSDKIYLTAPNVYGMYSAEIDLSYFDQYVGLRQAIPELWEAYEYFVKLRRDGINGKKLSQEQLTVMQYYPLPVDKCFTINFNPCYPDAVPPLTGAMGSALDILSYKKLVKDQAALSLFSIISCKIPMDKTTNKMALDYKIATEITQVMQNALPQNIAILTSPFDTEKMTADQSGRMEDIIDLGSHGFSTSSGVQAGSLGGGELKQAVALEYSSKVDFAYASQHMYTQFSNIVNIILAEKSKKFKFVVSFFGNALRREEEIELCGLQMGTSNAPASRYFATLSYEPFQVMPLLKLEDALGMKEMMRPLSSMFQVSGADGSGGAGEVPIENGLLDDNGEVVEENGE